MQFATELWAAVATIVAGFAAADAYLSRSRLKEATDLLGWYDQELTSSEARAAGRPRRNVKTGQYAKR